MKTAATAGANACVYIEHHLFARQMLGKGPTPRWLAVTQLDNWMRLLCLGACDIRVDLLETELQLIRIEPFRTPAELAALELPDDETELLNLAVPPLHAGRKIVHELMKERHIVRQIREIEPHA
jgi:hypothetical protein